MAAILEDPGLNPHQTLMHILLPSSTFTQNKNLLHSLTDYRVSMYWKWYSKSESTLELQSRVALSVEYLTPNMVPTLEAIPEEGGWIKKDAIWSHQIKKSLKYFKSFRISISDLREWGTWAFVVWLVIDVCSICSTDIYRLANADVTNIFVYITESASAVGSTGGC